MLKVMTRRLDAASDGPAASNGDYQPIRSDSELRTMVHDELSEALLTSVDGKITACDTGAIAGTVTANAGTDLNTSLLATEATLATLDGKVTACDTTALATEATLAALDAKVTACDTTALATEATLSGLDAKVTACDTSALATEASLSSIDGKITACDTGSVAGAVTANAGTNLNTSALALEATLTSLLRAFLGSGSAPTISSGPTLAVISAAADTADQSIIAAQGANTQIWVTGWYGTADTGDGSISWQDEDDNTKTGVMAVAENGMYGAVASSIYRPLMKVATNKALEMDTVTCGFKGAIEYIVVSV